MLEKTSSFCMLFIEDSLNLIFVKNINRHTFPKKQTAFGRLSCGDSLCEDPAPFDNIYFLKEQIESIIRFGWLPRCLIGHFVVWRRRIWNPAADFLANYLIQQRTYFELTHPDVLALLGTKGAMVRVHTDGARKSASVPSSAAFIVSVSSDQF